MHSNTVHLGFPLQGFLIEIKLDRDVLKVFQFDLFFSFSAEQERSEVHFTSVDEHIRFLDFALHVEFLLLF